jgi:putative holliday junction resolvase
MKILAIDHGTKKIGLAVSDETLLIAAPLDTIRPKSIDEALQTLAKIVEFHQISEIIIGIPYLSDQSDNPQSLIIKNFANKLQEYVGLNISFWDESFSSQIAEKGARKRKRKNSDSEAARIILQEYLDYIRNEKNSNIK